MDVVLRIAEFIGAAASIIAAFGGLRRIIKKLDKMENAIDKIPEIENKIDAVTKELDKVNDELKINSLDTYRLVITNDEMPVEERIAAGERYLEAGGNGGVKLYVLDLVREHDEEKHSELLKNHAIH